MAGKIVVPGRQHFSILWPLSTHWRQASCREVNCPRYVLGFTVKLDESIESHHGAAEDVRHKYGMEFVEYKDAEGLTTFEFSPGQECFEGRAGRHRIKLDRPEVLTQRTAQGTRRFSRGREFNEAMNEEMYAIERLQERR